MVTGRCGLPLTLARFPVVDRPHAPVRVAAAVGSLFVVCDCRECPAQTDWGAVRRYRPPAGDG